jgi:hypothetical protein
MKPRFGFQVKISPVGTGFQGHQGHKGKTAAEARHFRMIGNEFELLLLFGVQYIKLGRSSRGRLW